MPKIATAAQTAGSLYNRELKEVPVKDLQLDALNPRVRYLAETKGLSPKTNKDICNLLFEDDDVKRLYQDIKRAGKLHEPIFLNKDGSIIEGNSRVACFLKLIEKDGHHGHWKVIPALVSKDLLSPSDVAALQAYFHVRMKNKWAAFAQAGHIHTMHHDHKMSVDEIYEQTGLQRKNIKNMIKAYETMKASLKGKILDPASLVRKYSYYLELQKSTHPDVVDFRTKPQNVKKFTKWVETGKFSRGEDVRKLPSVLGDKQAVKALEEKDMAAATSIVTKSNPAAGSRLYRQIKTVSDELNKSFMKQVDQARTSAQHRKLLEDLKNTIDNILQSVKK